MDHEYQTTFVSSSTDKRDLGQYYTTNADYILQGFEKLVQGKKVTDPFAGQGDLLQWAKTNGAMSIRGFDINKDVLNYITTFYNDSIKDPKEYEFVITNPPYRYYNQSDLYLDSIKSLMNSEEGILILPINFFSASNSSDVRTEFMNKFKIKRVNVFKEQVFRDTTYNVCAFYYCLKEPEKVVYQSNFYIFPENVMKSFQLSEEFNWQVGGYFSNTVKKAKNFLDIYRVTEKNINANKGFLTLKGALGNLKNKVDFSVSEDYYKTVKRNIILLKAIDTGTDEGQIGLYDIRKEGIDVLVGKESSRNQAHLILPDYVDIEAQEHAIQQINTEFRHLRNKYESLFLTNYRDNYRKRISFNFAYNLISLHLLHLKEEFQLGYIEKLESIDTRIQLN